MTTETILDFDKLVAPLNDANPVGVDLRAETSADAFYYQLKDARSAARNAERKSIENGESITTVTSSWQPLLKLCTKALTEQGKDLEVASWLTECLVRIHGFAGLRDGLRLLRELITNFWPEVYPAEDEEGLATKLKALNGLSGDNGPGTLIMPIHCVPVVSGNGQEVATWQYQQAIEIAQITDSAKRKQRIDNGAVALETLQNIAQATSPEFFAELKNKLKGCQEEFAGLNEVLDEKCGDIAPSMANIRRALDDCDKAVEALTKHLSQDQEDAVTTEDDNTTADDATKNVKGNRQELFGRLQEIAEFFRRTEPHSPISYLLEQAIRWGDMELPELMKELLAEPKILTNYYRLVGIKPPQPQQQPMRQPNQDMMMGGGIGMHAPDMGMGSDMGMDNNQFDDEFRPPENFNFPGGQPPGFPG